jgi:hypothetical protein
MISSLRLSIAPRVWGSGLVESASPLLARFDGLTLTSPPAPLAQGVSVNVVPPPALAQRYIFLNDGGHHKSTE